MVYNPAIWVTCGGEMITPEDIQSVSIYSAVDRTLPEMNFIISDKFGAYERGMKFYLGASVGAMLVNMSYETDGVSKDTSGVTEPTVLANFAVCGTESGHENNDKTFGGMLTVYCRQAWYFWGNYQGHAYAPQKISELIKTICTDADKMAGLEVDEDEFVESSDPGDIPRYKSGESDLKFIETKLLPYTNIEDSNVFFYVDFYNKPHLTSFDQMKRKEPRILLTPPPELRTSVHKAIFDYKDEHGEMEEYYWLQIKSKVGDQDIEKQLGQIKVQLSLENNSTGKVYVCEQRSSVAMGANGLTAYNGLLPVGMLHMEGMEFTSSRMFPHRILSDALSMSRNYDLYLDDMFYIEVSVSNFVTDLIPGDMVYLFVPMNETDEGGYQVNWHQGKWVVHSMRVDFSGVDKSMVTTLGLMRPTLILNTSSTSVINPDRLYLIDD